MIGSALLLGVVPASSAAAAWPVTTSPGGSGRAMAVTLPAGNQPAATVTPSNGTTVTVSWTANADPVNGYVVRSYDAVTGTPRTVGAACAGTIATTSCVESGVPEGRWTYTVMPLRQSWTGDESPQSSAVVIDTTAPAPVITFPAVNTTYSAATWNSGCASQICGTATDALSGVAGVTVSVRQGSGNYWNGTAFASATEVLLPATGTTSWTLPFSGSNFPASGTYTVRAVASDAVGNTTSVSSTFTIDITPPAPTAIVLFNASGSITPSTDEARITFSEPLSTTSICSAWSGTGDQTLGGSGVVVSIVNGGALGTNDVLSVTASGCTVHVGSISLGGDYVLLNSTFSGSTTATESRVTWTAATRVLTVHLGARTSGADAVLPALAGTAVYTPDGNITDAVGNAVSPAPFSQGGVRL